MKEFKPILDKLLSEAQITTNILFVEARVMIKWPEIIFRLQEIDGADNIVEIAKSEYTARDIANKLIKSDFINDMNKYHQLICLENSVIPPDVYQSLYEEKIKIKGEIWIIYKTDKDVFPSNPHAHNYEKSLKLHLGNGRLYQGKKEVGKINKKNLLEIRTRIKNIALPSLEIG